MLRVIALAAALFTAHYAGANEPPPVSSYQGEGCPCTVGPCDCVGCTCSDLTLCGPPGCSGPGCKLSVGGSFTAPAQLTYSLRSADSHTHTCPNPRCGYTWGHDEDGGTHLCPKCKTFQNRVSNAPRGTSNARYNTGGPAELWEGSPPAPQTSQRVSESYTYSASTRSREPVLRVFGGPGLFRSMFGGRVGCR